MTLLAAKVGLLVEVAKKLLLVAVLVVINLNAH